MSGRQKSKKQKTARDREAETYDWEPNESAVVVSYTKNSLHPEMGIYCVPVTRIHPLLKPAVEANSQVVLYMGDNVDDNVDLFHNLTSKDIRKWQNAGSPRVPMPQTSRLEDEEDEECEEGGVDDEEEIGDDEMDDITESIFMWLGDNNLGAWLKNPPTAVKIVCRVSAFESC